MAKNSNPFLQYAISVTVPKAHRPDEVQLKCRPFFVLTILIEGVNSTHSLFIELKIGHLNTLKMELFIGAPNSLSISKDNSSNEIRVYILSTLIFTCIHMYLVIPIM